MPDINGMGDPPQHIRSAWDTEKSASLKGSIVLVGITYVNAANEPLEQLQLFGLVTETDERSGIAIACDGEVMRGQTYRLPPDTDAFRAAAPGTYRLRTTGEELTDPGYTSSWTILRPKDGLQ